MKRRYYFDTSVFGGVFDEEFKESSIQLFEQVNRGKVICLFSEVVDNELIEAPKRVRDFFNGIPSVYMERLSVSAKVESLAALYIKENVVGRTSYEDCLHIALASINMADALVSWNFKHIANAYKIKGYNSVNLHSGYRELRIRSPKQISTDEKDDQKNQEGL